MIIDNLNLNLLRVFESVYRTKSMTKAACELHMTQSGVSQNIKNLEEILSITLFDRVKQRPIPTQKANVLFDKCSNYFVELEDTLAELKGEDRQLKGTICLGLPIEFGTNIVLPLLSKWGRKHPRIKYNINYGHHMGINELLVKGELDFAIVDNFAMDRQIKMEPIADETLNLYASKKYLEEKGGSNKGEKKFFESLEYCAYEPDCSLIKSWFKHHYKFGHIELNPRSALMDVQGVGQMISHGLGVGILPEYVGKQLKNNGASLHTFKGCGQPLHNTLSLAYLEKRTRSVAVEETMDFLRKSLSSKLS